MRGISQLIYQAEVGKSNKDKIAPRRHMALISDMLW
jgi:hypothetical protein